MISRNDFSTTSGAGDRSSPILAPLLAANRVRQQATRTAQLAQSGDAGSVPGTRLAPGDGAFNTAAAAVLNQWKDQ